MVGSGDEDGGFVTIERRKWERAKSRKEEVIHNRRQIRGCEMWGKKISEMITAGLL